MGDRGNIVVVDRGKRVYLYTHWNGSEIKKIAADALKRGESRWTDPSYLTRIIFCELVKGHEGGTTGFGISTELGDNGNPILIVDCDTQEVYFEDNEDEKRYAFKQFLELDWLER